MNELSITYNKEDMELLRFTPLSIDDEARQKRAKTMAAHYSHPIEIPNLYKQMRVAVYIRYFNSADIEDWLDAILSFNIRFNHEVFFLRYQVKCLYFQSEKKCIFL